MDETSFNEISRRRKRRSLAFQLGLFTSLLLILTGLLLGLISYALAERIIRDQIHQRLKLAANDRKELVHQYVDRQKERVALVASRTQLRALIDDYLQGKLDKDAMRAATESILRDALASTGDFRTISVISVTGEVLTATDYNHVDLTTTRAFQVVVDDSHQAKGFLDEPFLSKGRIYAHLAAPAISRDNRVLGVVVVLLDVEQLESILRDISDAERFGETGELLIGRRDGQRVHYLLPSGRDYKQKADATAVPGMVAAIEGRSEFQRTLYDGVPVLMHYEPIDYQDPKRSWGLVAKLDVAEAYQPLVQFKKTLLLIQAGLLAIGLFAAIALAHRFTRPIMLLNHAARQFAGGDLTQRVDVQRDDELGELADSFNEMAESLHQLNSHLEHLVEDRTSELAEARDIAESASHAKSDFLANMSHEIRTPLNAVIGLTEIVMGTDLNDTQREYLGTVIDSAESLLGIINDILDFSKIEAGMLKLEQVHFNLQDIVGDTLKSLAMRARQKELELACLVDPALPTVLVGDPTRLRQVITNLVANAIKFTQHGEVVVRVGLSNEAPIESDMPSAGNDEEIAYHQQLLFAVSDTGIGIDPRNLDRLFEAFEQGDTSTARRFGGTGLGLSICLRLVQRMRGRLWATSVLGEGSQFCFTAQLGVPVTVAKNRPKLTLPLEGLRVLIVDDNATNLQILKEVTLAKKMLPEMADSATAAMAIMQHAYDDGKPIRLILSDVNMPVQDGFELAEMIRQDHRFDLVEIIFLTSAGQTGDQSRCADLRIAARLMKPVKQSELYEVMVRTLGIEDHYVAVQFDSPKQHAVSIPPLRILLVEDSVANQKVALGILTTHQHSVVVANDGCEALRCLECQDFDVVLMDVQMPVMDGLEATRVIRQQELGTNRHQPVIAMTAEAIEGDREKCLQAGMDDYVTKPIRRSELFSALARASGFGSQCDADLPSQTVNNDSQHRNWTIYDASSVDLSGLMHQVNDDHMLLREVVAQYVAEIQDNLLKLPDCIAARECKEVKRRAHMLAGAMRMFDVQQSWSQARDLESLAGKNELSEADSVYQQLNKSVLDVLPELERFLNADQSCNENISR